MNILILELEKLRPARVNNDYDAGWDQAITQAQIVIEERCAIAAGTQRAETGETPAPSEGCQSGGEAASPNTSHRSTGE